MPCKIDIIILSNVPKKFDPGIKVVVGLPARNPWSLPFGHKKLFAERVEDYDLFIYSEDDILITWKNIDFYLQLSKVLPEGYISGFLRYEIDPTGRKWYPDFVGPYHWLSKSVNKLDRITVAEFSNYHSACYALTQDQLRKAIKSGGYLVESHQGRYDLLCSAATDPYTQCGLKKVICISNISDVLVHHLSNRYTGMAGIDENDFDRQIVFMLSEANSDNVPEELFMTTKNIDSITWDKVYFDRADCNVLSLVSNNTNKILSVGCGYPSTETILVQNKNSVTVIPLDSVIGALTASKGIKVMEPNFEKAFHDLDGNLFDYIIFSNVLQHLKDPVEILSRAIKLLAPDGEILITIPNYRYVKFLKDHFPYPIFKRWNYSKNYLQMVGKYHLIKWFRLIGVEGLDFLYVDESQYLTRLRPSLGIFDALFPDILFANMLITRGKKKTLSGNK